jgi:hypothetical protein
VSEGCCGCLRTEATLEKTPHGCSCQGSRPALVGLLRKHWLRLTKQPTTCIRFPCVNRLRLELIVASPLFVQLDV